MIQGVAALQPNRAIVVWQNISHHVLRLNRDHFDFLGRTALVPPG